MAKRAVVEAQPLELVQEDSPAPAQAMVAAQPAANTPAGMMHALAASGMDPASIREMLAIQKDWEANEARKAYVAAMAEFKMNPPEILKRKLVEFATNDGGTTSYRHATLSDVTSAIVEGLAKSGFSHRWDTAQGEGGVVVVTCVLTHRLGHSESTVLRSAPDQSGKKNAIQAVGSAVSYLQRYTLLAATGLATKDMDDDGHAAEIERITDEQAATIRDMLEATGSDRAKFLAFLKVSKVEDIPAQAFPNAMAALKAKERAARG